MLLEISDRAFTDKDNVNVGEKDQKNQRNKMLDAGKMDQKNH